MLSDAQYSALCKQMALGRVDNVEDALSVFEEVGNTAKEPAPAEEMSCMKCRQRLVGDIASVKSCGHVFHPLCLAHSLADRIRDGVWPLSCPTCPADIDLYEARALPKAFRDIATANASIYEHFIDNPRQTTWCPTLGCRASLLLNEEIECRCRRCHLAFCMQCRSPAHPSFSCQDVKPYLSATDLSSMLFYVRNGVVLKCCPFCHLWNLQPLNKNAMQCLCGHTFCSVCGKEPACGCKPL